MECIDCDCQIIAKVYIKCFILIYVYVQLNSERAQQLVLPWRQVTCLVEKVASLSPHSRTKERGHCNHTLSEKIYFSTSRRLQWCVCRHALALNWVQCALHLWLVSYACVAKSKSELELKNCLYSKSIAGIAY